MKFFIDTANVGEIRKAASWGILDGVTTNPSLVAKEGRDFEEVLREICGIVNGPVSAEVTAVGLDGVLAAGGRPRPLHPHLVVQVPRLLTRNHATKDLFPQGIPVN